MPPVLTSDLIPLAAAVERTNYSDYTLRAEIRAGHLRCRRLGARGKIMFAPADLDEWIDSLSRGAAETDRRIDALVAAAPPLSADQRAKLAVLLNGAGGRNSTPRSQPRSPILACGSR
jgi:uncharacterized protein (DUF1778 family)